MGDDCMEEVRGRITYRDRRRQIVTYENVRYGNATPTDIDGALDYHGDAFAFIEIKYGDTELKDGQRKFLEGVADGLFDGGREAAVFVVSHDIEDVNEDIDAADCIVREIYMRHRWIELKEPKTLKEQMDVFFKYAEESRQKREKARAITKITAQYANAMVEALK